MNHPIWNRVLLLGLLLGSAPLAAETHFTLSGSASSNNLGPSKQFTRAASVSVAVDLGNYFRIGLTHRQATNTLDGYQSSDSSDSPQYIVEKTHNIANSADLTIILYYGQIFVPYIQTGMVKKEYYIDSAIQGSQPETNHISLPPVPYGGLGLGIRLNSNFSLKLAYTVSPGVIQDAPGAEPRSALDSYTSVGISYNI